MPTWRAIFDAVRDGTVDAGVCAIENSLAGSIRETYDLLAQFDLSIVGEVSVPVRLALLALPGQAIESIERVYSKAEALAQADEYLRSRPWQVLTTYNTAGAARQIAERRETGAAAVASPRVAAIYGLEILADGIQSGAENRTRFAVLARGPAVPDGWRAAGAASRSMPTEPESMAIGAVPGAVPTVPTVPDLKTTLVFAVRNVPGSLHRCLGAFAEAGINLSRLESRPTRAARWEYVFWVDLDADPATPACAAALEALRAEAAMVRILGTYPRAAED
ncbi:MAG: ACT domain-containing protein [Chloroflexi bacterium]|nr:ACT domain-containing protein [Chloroflexota bacterium]